MEKELSGSVFLAEYADAFRSGDGSHIARFYNAPCLSVRADGSVHTFTERDEIEAFFTKVADTYAKEGMAQFSADDVATEPMGNVSCQIVCTWSMKRRDESLIRKWRQTYILNRDASDWKIIASVFHA